LDDTGINGRIILRWIFRNWDERAWTGLIWFKVGIIQCGNVLVTSGYFLSDSEPVSFSIRPAAWSK
jgi:hypothetical protein